MNAPLPIHLKRDSAEGALCFRLPAGMLTLEQFCDWVESEAAPERGRISYLDSQIEVDMSPENLAAHNRVKTLVPRMLGNLIEEHDLGEFISDGMLFVSPQANVANEPDGMFVSWKSLESGHVFYQPPKHNPDSELEVRGNPDLVLEVVSDSSVHKDTVHLPQAYFAAGVHEYWIIDARGPKPKFTILVRGKQKFVARKANVQGYVASAVFGIAFRLVRYKNRMGHIAFRLEQRASR